MENKIEKAENDEQISFEQQNNANSPSPNLQSKKIQATLTQFKARLQPITPIKNNPNQNYQKVINKFCSTQSNLFCDKADTHAKLLTNANNFWNQIKGNLDEIHEYLTKTEIESKVSSIQAETAWLVHKPAENTDNRKRKERSEENDPQIESLPT